MLFGFFVHCHRFNVVVVAPVWFVHALTLTHLDNPVIYCIECHVWQSGNPGGRPKTAPPSNACREWMASQVPGDPEGRTGAQAIAKMLGEKASLAMFARRKSLRIEPKAGRGNPLKSTTSDYEKLLSR